MSENDGKKRERLVTSLEVAARLSCSVRTVWRLVAAGRFPAPVRYNRKLVRWKEGEVDAYLESLRGGEKAP